MCCLRRTLTKCGINIDDYFAVSQCEEEGYTTIFLTTNEGFNFKIDIDEEDLL